jgi:hypothetical protein
MHLNFLGFIHLYNRYEEIQITKQQNINKHKLAYIKQSQPKYLNGQVQAVTEVRYL